MIRKDKSSPSTSFPKVAEEFLVRVICENLEASSSGRPVPNVELLCFTTHKRDGNIYHAHPDCHGKMWYDWVNISFLYADDPEEPISIPGQILMFVDFRNHMIPNMDNLEGYDGPGTYAVVRCLDGEPTPLENSVLILTGRRHKEVTLVSTEHFHEPVCVVDNLGCPNKSVLIVRPRRDWADEFC
jgi:hypothetical protein